MKYLNLLVFSLLNPIYGIGQGTPNCSNATIIGNTFYENQANQGNPGRLIYEWPDNTMAAVWMIGSNTPTFSDRGTGYNFYNGSWNALPTNRVEAVRTGFPNIIGGINNNIPDVRPQQLSFNRRIFSVYFKTISIETIEPILRSNPDKAIIILNDFSYIVTAEAVGLCVFAQLF